MKNPIKFHPCVCKRRPDEPVVQNGLAVTPAQMMELTQSGFSISAQNLNALEAADPSDKDFYVPVQYRRGSDLADVYEAAQEVRRKVKKAVQKVDSGEIADLSNPGKE